MASEVSFEVDVTGSDVAGTLWLPDSATTDGEVPAVLICPDSLRQDAAAESFGEEITTSLLAAGLAVATYRPRAAHAPETVEGFVDEASAVMRSVMLRANVDSERLGVLGAGLGALIAACLGARTDAIARLCLIAPLTPEDLVRRCREETKSEEGSNAGVVARRRLVRLADSLSDVDPLADAAMRGRPILILHGAADRTLATTSSEAYAERIRTAGHKVQMLLAARSDHDLLDPAARPACLDRISGFFAAMTSMSATSAGA